MIAPRPLLYRALLFLPVALCLLVATGCERTEELQLKGEEFLITDAYLNNDRTLNALELLLPLYDEAPSRCQYYVYFEENGRVNGYYYTFDTLHYAAVGEWEQLEYGRIYLRIDSDINGEFEVDRRGDGIFYLSTQQNRTSIFTDPIPLEVRVKAE